METGGVRAAKAMGLRNLPSKSWQVNCGWVIAANIAADLAAWTRLLGFRDDPGLREADPDTLRYRVWHIPARLARHARERVLKISPDWPWKDAFLTCWQRLLRPASTRLISTTIPSGAKAGIARRGRSQCAPGHPGHHRATAPGKQADNRPETSVRGHEKVPVYGQVEVLAGGQFKSPHPSFAVSAWSLRPGRRRWRCQPVTVTAQGASIEVCEGSDGHHFGLP